MQRTKSVISKKLICCHKIDSPLGCVSSFSFTFCGRCYICMCSHLRSDSLIPRGSRLFRQLLAEITYSLFFWSFKAGAFAVGKLFVQDQHLDLCVYTWFFFYCVYHRSFMGLVSSTSQLTRTPSTYPPKHTLALSFFVSLAIYNTHKHIYCCLVTRKVPFRRLARLRK